MKVGTKSILFGVHAFWWHPITVALAWRRVWHEWPDWRELVAIFVHDLGYWGRDNMDGVEGKLHPVGGAKIIRWLGLGEELQRLVLLHSQSFADAAKQPVSRLFLPDKVSVLYDPSWFYLLRAVLSGEIDEYVMNSPMRFHGADVWLRWYQARVWEWLYAHDRRYWCPDCETIRAGCNCSPGN